MSHPETDPTHPQRTNRGAPSVFLRVLGAVFVALGFAWAHAFIGVVQEGAVTTFIGARTGVYALTYILSGVGMFLHARWAALAVAAWAVAAFSQLVYPPIPRASVPLMAQIAIALIALFWMLGLVFYVNRRTRMQRHDA